MKLVPAKFAPFLVSNARPVILSPMALPVIQWCVHHQIKICYVLLISNHSQTSMFVPDPVISLAIKPIGNETPNFSRALNRFQKEDPTFRVHIDRESKEVRRVGIPNT